MRRVIIAVLAAAGFLLGTAGAAHAIRDPFIVCVRECTPPGAELPPLPEPGPCHGVLDGFC